MADMTPTPWGKGTGGHRYWPNGSQAVCAYDDGSWSVRHPGFGSRFAQWGQEYAVEDLSDVNPMGGRLAHARQRADEALSLLLAEMAAEVARG